MLWDGTDGNTEFVFSRGMVRLFKSRIKSLGGQWRKCECERKGGRVLGRRGLIAAWPVCGVKGIERKGAALLVKEFFLKKKAVIPRIRTGYAAV